MNWTAQNSVHVMMSLYFVCLMLQRRAVLKFNT